jgi:hypothetical protein
MGAGEARLERRNRRANSDALNRAFAFCSRASGRVAANCIIGNSIIPPLAAEVLGAALDVFAKQDDGRRLQRRNVAFTFL